VLALAVSSWDFSRNVLCLSSARSQSEAKCDTNGMCPDASEVDPGGIAEHSVRMVVFNTPTPLRCVSIERDDFKLSPTLAPLICCDGSPGAGLATRLCGLIERSARPRMKASSLGRRISCPEAGVLEDEIFTDGVKGTARAFTVPPGTKGAAVARGCCRDTGMNGAGIFLHCGSFRRVWRVDSSIKVVRAYILDLVVPADLRL